MKSLHQEDGSLPPRTEPTESSTARQIFKLVFCAAGLQVGALCMCAWLWEQEVGSRFAAVSFLKTKDAVLSLIRAGLEAGTQTLNQDSPPGLLGHF